MKKILFIAAVTIVFASCRRYPDFNELTYQPVVVTNHDSTANFGIFKTYYLPISVRLISDDRNDTLVNDTYGKPIIDAIESNMNSRGYTRVLTPPADLGLDVAAITITNIAYYDPYYYWGYGGYYPYYGGGYYPYYPYYGGGYTYTYTTGSLMVQMSDLVNLDTVNHKIRFIWSNFNVGVLGNSSTYNSAAGVSAINQAFKQSAYIKTN